MQQLAIVRIVLEWKTAAKAKVLDFSDFVSILFFLCREGKRSLSVLH